VLNPIKSHKIYEKHHNHNPPFVLQYPDANESSSHSTLAN
jgi:hypothetical protein